MFTLDWKVALHFSHKMSDVLYFCFVLFCFKGEILPVSFLSSHEEGPAAKKCKTEKEETHISISSLAEGNVTKVS